MYNNKTLLKNAFASVFEQGQIDEASVSRYFDKQYTQWVDGHELDFNGFVEHLAAQRKRVEKVNVTFRTILAEGDQVSTVHLIDAMTKEGNAVKGKVIALFSFRNGKILSCEELTYFDEVSEQDKDLGSVR